MVVRYPFALNDRLAAGNLNRAFEYTPGTTPPSGNAGGAGTYSYWVDTSTALPTLRMCVAAPRATAGVYNAAQWIPIGQISVATGRMNWYAGSIAVSTDITAVNVTASGTVTGAYLRSTGNVQADNALTTSGVLTVSGGATISGHTALNTLGVAGTSQLNGLVTANTINVTGTSQLNGTVTTNAINAASLTAIGTVQGAFLSSTGGASIAGNTLTGSLNVTGNVAVTGTSSLNGAVSTNALTCTGITVNGSFASSGGMTVGGSISSASQLFCTGANSGITLDDRANTAAKWVLYANANIFRIFLAGTGDRFSVDNVGNAFLAGNYVFFTGGGANSSWIYADNGQIQFRLGIGNVSHYWINGAGTTIGSLHSSGVLDIWDSLAFRGATVLKGAPLNTSYIYIYDNSGAEAIALGRSADQTNYYRQLEHRFTNRIDAGAPIYAMFNAGGCFNVNGGWGYISDRSMKEQIHPYERGLDAVLALEPVTFVYKSGTVFSEADGATPSVRIGLIAQDVAEVIPEMVGEIDTTLNDDLVTVSTTFPTHLNYVMINAIQELAARVAVLEGTPAGTTTRRYPK